MRKVSHYSNLGHFHVVDPVFVFISPGLVSCSRRAWASLVIRHRTGSEFSVQGSWLTHVLESLGRRRSAHQQLQNGCGVEGSRVRGSRLPCRTDSPPWPAPDWLEFNGR